MTKDFDCVDMKRRGSDYVREQTKGMTREQLIAYWADRTRAFKAEVDAAHAAKTATESQPAQRRSA